ncbi:serine/threonine protein kinase [Paenibacillus sp. J31TS4]|uniref:serine/threonine protein kinase n=1 Tax=Paenibacillus sp. J31TS4 TaxID=2807195 RepID=UPI001B2985E7|nr:serine/threonine protein kinase [Paenibacillus sp. J31TS4]GIP37133.1 serine/threonine protein kinase [Paenibacillus sp. J31TS4]
MSYQPVTQTLDHVSFALRESHPLDWLREKGTVFRVFDQQDSGNLSFGIESGGRKQFVKYAGARPIRYEGTPEEAVARLREAAAVYERLAHPALVRLLAHGEAGEGYALLFEWEDGETLHHQATYPLGTEPASPYLRFRQLPIGRRRKAMEQILAFHESVEDRGYTAVDFYDGSLLYDFGAHKLTVCDIDLYRRSPFRNPMGRMWGSSRFMSPEEFELGAPIDGVTNVYNLAAMAFWLLGGGRDRSPERWEAGEALYAVSSRGVQPAREDRYPSVRSFREAWDDASS